VSLTDFGQPKKKKRNGSRNWFLWWNIGPYELKEQVEGYKTLKIYQSARGISLLLFIGSAVLTALLTELMTHDRSSYVDVALFVILGVFIYFGHRWAMVLGMVLWTLEKVFQVVMLVRGKQFANPFMILLFWAIFMHAMLLAFRTEQARRQQVVINPAVFD
jgi:hypothetical protein